MADGAVAGIDPTQYETDVVLRDGSTVRVRAIRPDDRDRLAEFLTTLSEQSRALRFFGTTTSDSLRRKAEVLTDVDYTTTFGLVATVGRQERIIGHAMYAAVTGDRAEVAFVIGDDLQGQGLGTILLGQLAQIAVSNDIHTFEAVFLPHNRKMLDVFRASGFPVQVEPAPGEILAEFPTALTEEAVGRFEQREWSAAVSAMRAFFHPRSVAVLGASRDRGSIGGRVMHNLLSFGFHGPVLPVNPGAPVVQSVLAYPGVDELPGEVDLAVIVVPEQNVLEVAEACGRKGVRGLVVISAGFAEAGPEGRARQEELVRICRASGMRLIGPNCMGIVNTHREVRLNATFSPTAPPAGRVAFMSQSGALGLAIMDHARARGLGLSTFVAVGNKADISGNDMIRYWEQDPCTDVILLYLESFGNPRKFSRVARRVARVKPIVAVKSGRSLAGARATSSHTGALIAASDVPVDALFRNAGVVRTDTLEEMFDVASLLSSQPPPSGRRVAILTNAGGPGVLCADACEAQGLEIPVLAENTRAELRALLPSDASIENPIDVNVSTTPDQYREAIRIVRADPGVDAVIVIFIPPMVKRPGEAARAILDGARSAGPEKPVLTVSMQARSALEARRAEDERLPSFAFPEDAAIALARATQYGEWLARPLPEPARFDDVRHDYAAAVVASALGRGGGWLPPDELRTLLSCYGLPMLEQHIAATPAQAADAAADLGAPIALKAIAPELVHKAEAGGVRLNVKPKEVRREARAMEQRVREAGATPSGFLVQRMAPDGAEMIVGVVHDPHFGPLVACGAGGVLVELLKDVSVRLTPLARRDAEEMVRELNTYPLLTGYRGGVPRDVPALEDAILRIGAMADALPQIAELDLNPILVHEHGATIVDAKVRVAPAAPRPLLGARR